MIFQIKHTKPIFLRSNFLKMLLMLFFVSVLVFTFNSFSWARSFIFDVFSPLSMGGNSFYNFLDQVLIFFINKNELVKNNVELSNKIENLYNSISDYESIKYENQKLRQELGLKPIANSITSSVIAKPPQTSPDSLFLDKGVNDGINDGDSVLIGERILIGKIVKTNQGGAVVALNSFAGVISYGFVARTDEPLEIKGAGGGSMETKVPIDFDIIVGDRIMVANSTNYLVAVVGDVEENNSSGFKNVLMSLPVNISKTNIVFVESIIKE